jgi:hypothetical protein
MNGIAGVGSVRRPVWFMCHCVSYYGTILSVPVTSSDNFNMGSNDECRGPVGRGTPARVISIRTMRWGCSDRPTLVEQLEGSHKDVMNSLVG